MSKSGFVYIWFDKTRKMYYIGCHWGHMYDKYICSSSHMINARKHRPEDFKRRILKKDIPSKKETIEEEFRWLSMIKKEELGKRYYNHHNHHFNHWSSAERAAEIAAKCGNKNKGKFFNHTPEQTAERSRLISEGRFRASLRKREMGLPIRAKEKTPRPSGYTQSEEIKQKKSETMKRLYKDGDWKPWSAGKTLGPQNPERIEKRASKLRGKKRSDEQRQTISEANKESWASGKYANRKSNNMKDFIWVHFKETKKNTRILSRNFDPSTMNRGRSPRTEDSYGI